MLLNIVLHINRKIVSSSVKVVRKRGEMSYETTYAVNNNNGEGHDK